ncbi:MAG TPA: hypothetical protein VLW54_04690 [Candidatus Acidoferrales bacterium]|nr:hypothetical protein [Candidatus Acidoferrales bacterium]
MRAELLVLLAKDRDSMVNGRAVNALAGIAPEVLLEAARQPDVALPVLQYVAEHATDRAAAASALMSNRYCPGDALALLADQLSPKDVSAILDNLEQLASSRELIIALAARTDLTLEQQRMLEELTSEADKHAIEQMVDEAEPDPEKRKTLVQRLSTMNVVERLTLALKGGREERMALIRDPNKMVQRAVLQSPRLTDQEVENFSAMANVSDEVLRTISLNRNFIKNYAIVRNLIYNPKTPVDISLHFLSRLITTDLKKLTMNKNVPETVRGMATKMVRQKAILGQN